MKLELLLKFISLDLRYDLEILMIIEILEFLFSAFSAHGKAKNSIMNVLHPFHFITQFLKNVINNITIKMLLISQF